MRLAGVLAAAAIAAGCAGGASAGEDELAAHLEEQAWNGFSGASMSETPPSGMRKRTGPSMRLSLSPIHFPIASFSAAVVRISVTLGLWT